MKNVLLLSFILLLVVISCNVITVNAKEVSYNSPITTLRAGGASSGGSHSSSGGSSSSGHYGRRGYSNPIVNIIFYIIFAFALFASAIILYFKVLRASFNSKRYLRLLDNKDITWKYKNIEKRVIETFYIVQEAWTNNDMERARDYIDKDLYESFRIKLEWMDVNNKRNVLKKIRLVNLKPVSVYDDKDDKKDLIWFYIKGKMIDYIIDTKTKSIVSGNTKNRSFVEFWKFVKNDDNKWVLSEILQEDESKKLGL